MNTPTKPTFHAHGKDWFPHTLGDPMPCEPDDPARDLERELNIALSERDAARENAERLAGLLKRHDEMRRKAENQGQSKEGYREFPICKETRAALAAHEAIAKN